MLQICLWQLHACLAPSTKTLREIVRARLVTEPPPLPDETLRVRAALQEKIRSVLGRALSIRHVDAGSCNGCELELHALNNPLCNIDGGDSDGRFRRRSGGAEQLTRLVSSAAVG